MNREKVLALLKICGENLDCYESCPYYHVNEPKGFIGCMGALMSDAAKVIEEQTQHIWDLTVERKQLRDKLKEQHLTVRRVNVRWEMGIHGGNCPRCLNWVQLSYNYCPFCGTKMEEEEKSDA